MRINKNIRRLSLIILGILIFHSSFSQKNYLPGYLVSIKGDTLHGFIDYRNWDKNPNIIYFLDINNIETTLYTPTDIKLFSVHNETYISAIIKSENSSRNTNNLHFDSELKITIDTTFLQVMIRGVKSLYYYKNNNGIENFYIKQNEKFELLEYKMYFKNQGKNHIITENKKFIGQLVLYFNDCPSINSKLKDLRYFKKSLYKLFRFYYKCTKMEVIFLKKPEKISTEFGALAGVSISSIKFRSDSYDYLINVDFPSSVNFSTALFFNIILPRNQGKWSICNELFFCSYNVKGRYNDYVNEDKYTITDTELGYSYLKMNNMLRFKYPIKKLFIYFNAGISNGIAISEMNYRKIETKFYSNESIEEKRAINGTRKYEQRFILGLGTKFNNYSIEMRYEKGNGISDWMNLGSTTNSVFLLFGYKF